MSDLPILYTIPFSNYCEKGRFILDYSGIDYEELGALPGLHRRNMKDLPGRKTVPALITADGFYPESDDIARFAVQSQALPEHFLTILEEPEAQALHEAHDQLGIHGRRMAYHFLFNDKPSMMQLCRPFSSILERTALTLTFTKFKKMMFRYMKVTPENVIASRKFIDAHIQKCDDLLSQSPYFYGDEPTILDLEFAAFMTVIVMPDWWVTQVLRQESADLISDDFKKWRLQFKDTRSYQWTEEVYTSLRSKTFAETR